MLISRPLKVSAAFVAAALDIGVDEFGLGREVVVEAHLRDPRPRGDRVDPGRRDPLAIEELSGGIQQAVFDGGSLGQGDSPFSR